MHTPLVMGIVNVTPDSFSDGGRFASAAAALAHARRLIGEGADLLDIGGESTRPGAQPVAEAEEIDRVVPLIAAIRAECPIRISIDTMKPAVARAAVAAGASMWNDVTALSFAPDSAATAAELGCAVVLMHMRGTPLTMNAQTQYGDVVAEVGAALLGRVEGAVAAGVARERIWLDPGLGFAKTAAQSLALLANLDRLAALGYPVLLGASRKSFFKAVHPSAAAAEDRLGGSLVAALAGAEAGATAVRVHDVRQTVQALAMRAAIGQARAHD